MCNSKKSNCSSFPIILKHKKYINSWSRYNFETYKWNISLYLGDQLFVFDLVECFLFLSDKCGPIKLISTNGLNIPDTRVHFRSFAATTTKYDYLISFSSKIVYPILPLTVTLCSPVPGWVKRSTWIDTSPTLPSCASMLSTSINTLLSKGDWGTRCCGIKNTDIDLRNIHCYLKACIWKHYKQWKYVIIQWRTEVW